MYHIKTCLLVALPILCQILPSLAQTVSVGVIPKPAAPNTPKLNRRMMSADKPGLNNEMKWVGFSAHRSLDFFDFLDQNAKTNIENFDRLSVGLNVTIEGFFAFINKLVESKATDEGELEDEVPQESDDDDSGMLTKPQLARLFGDVNVTAVDYILETVGMTIPQLHEAFNAVDILLVLMYISSHFEPLGVRLSILDVVEGFCDDDGDYDHKVWPRNIAAKFSVNQRRVEAYVDLLHGKMVDIGDYILEIFRYDTCDTLKAKDDEPNTLQKSGGLRGAKPISWFSSSS